MKDPEGAGAVIRAGKWVDKDGADGAVEEGADKGWISEDGRAEDEGASYLLPLVFWDPLKVTVGSSRFQ